MQRWEVAAAGGGGCDGVVLPGHEDIEKQVHGLREGEKLYEKVLNELEGTKPTFPEKIHIAQVREYDFDEVSRELDALVETAKTFDKMETVRKMKQIVPEYKSNNSVYVVLDGERERPLMTSVNGMLSCHSAVSTWRYTSDTFRNRFFSL